MKLKSRATFAASLIAATCMFAAGGAHAAATIFNTGAAGTAQIAMGINDDGSLNTSAGSIVANSDRTGIAFKFGDGLFRDATSPGCYCEGWGVSTSSSGGHSGFANVSSDGGPNNLTFGALTGVTGSTATATTSLTSLAGLTVTQTFAPSTNAPGALFEVKVRITNTTGAALNDVKYVRVMDWDVPLTEFNEFVTIRGTGSTTLLEKSHLDGFASANPLNTGCDAGCGYGGVDVDVTDAGPADHGAYFRFNFGTIADGDSYEFSIFYGATASERTALAAIASEGLELYSLGQSSPPTGDPVAGTPATFVFGFKGVGGVVLIPTPGSLALVGLGLLGAGMVRRRRA